MRELQIPQIREFIEQYREAGKGVLTAIQTKSYSINQMQNMFGKTSELMGGFYLAEYNKPLQA
jgi:hypothetical protein